jgi:hypothetical protein
MQLSPRHKPSLACGIELCDRSHISKMFFQLAIMGSFEEQY